MDTCKDCELALIDRIAKKGKKPVYKLHCKARGRERKENDPACMLFKSKEA